MPQFVGLGRLFFVSLLFTVVPPNCYRKPWAQWQCSAGVLDVAFPCELCPNPGSFCWYWVLIVKNGVKKKKKALSLRANQVTLFFFCWSFRKDANFKCHLILSRTEGCREHTKPRKHSEMIVSEVTEKFQEGFGHQLHFVASRMDHFCPWGNAEQLQHGFVAVLPTEVLWIGPLLITLDPAGGRGGGTKIISWLWARNKLLRVYILLNLPCVGVHKAVWLCPCCLLVKERQINDCTNLRNIQTTLYRGFSDSELMSSRWARSNSRADKPWHSSAEATFPVIQ